jgi:Domain of unknown function (DUF4150)
MPVTVKVNGVANSLVHKGSNGISIATIPDVCKTPSPGGPIPIPYPNISQSATLAKGTTTVKADGGMMIAIKGSEFSLSNGDNPGVAGGVKSSTFMKESTWILYSFDVKMDGKNACRLTDKKFQNHENTADLAGVFVKPTNLSPADSRLWDDCEKQHDKYKKTQEEQALHVDAEYARLKASVAKPNGPVHERFQFAELLEKRIKIVKRLHRERKAYIDMGCDKFDWSNNGSTRAQREQDHRDELANVGVSLKNLHEAMAKLR